MEKTLIYKEDALAEIERQESILHSCDRLYPGNIKEIVKDMPSVDAVVVVRCKKCVFSDPTETFEDYRHCKLNRVLYKETHFCGYGKERDEAVAAIARMADDMDRGGTVNG